MNEIDQSGLSKGSAKYELAKSFQDIVKIEIDQAMRKMYETQNRK
jgi:hypothetical protein